jgi:hypothetical protein
VQNTSRSAYKRRRHHNDKGVTGIHARWLMFEKMHETVMAIEAALPLVAAR